MKGLLAQGILMAAFCVVLFSCRKSGDPMPPISVYFSGYLSMDMRLDPLNILNNAVIIDEHGIAGLIIYRHPDGSYVAYDRCSTYRPERKCALVLDHPIGTVTDPCSGSRFALWDGGIVLQGPARSPLKSYAVTIHGDQIVVSN